MTRIQELEAENQRLTEELAEIKASHIGFVTVAMQKHDALTAENQRFTAALTAQLKLTAGCSDAVADLTNEVQRLTEALQTAREQAKVQAYEYAAQIVKDYHAGLGLDDSAESRIIDALMAAREVAAVAALRTAGEGT